MRPQLTRLGLFRVKSHDVFIELTLRLCRTADTLYDFSKLYFAVGIGGRYSDERTICFRLRQSGVVERMRLLIPPEGSAAGWIRLRLEAFVRSYGACEVVSARLVPEDGGELSRQAYLIGLKSKVRAQVIQSELLQRATVPHLPESWSN